MARIMTCGFELQTSLEFTGLQSGSITPTTSYGTPGPSGITGSHYLHQTTNGFGSGVSGVWADAIATATEIYFRFRMRFHNIDAGSQTALGFTISDSSGNQILRITGSAGALTATIGAATAGGATTILIVDNVWTLIEGHILLDNSVGVIEIKQDGNMVYTFSGDSNPDARADMKRLLVGYINFHAASLDTDDMAINDTTGSKQNGWCGDGTTFYQGANGNGSSSDMLGSDGDSTNNYLHVDDAVPDGDASYVSADTTGLKDEYALADLPTLPSGSSIQFVQPVAIARRADPGVASSLDVGILSGATEDFAASQALTMSYAMYRGTYYYVDPDTGVDWDTTGVDALETGIRSA